MFNFSIDWCPAKASSCNDPNLNGPCRCRFPWSSKQPSGKMRLGTQVFGYFPCRFRWEISSINGGFHCIPLLWFSEGFFRVLETWNDQGRMILIIYIYILMLMLIYPARYFAVFLGTSWRHRVLRVSRKAKHTLKLTLFRAWNVTAYPYEFCLFWPPTLINNDKYLVGGLEHGFYDFPFSWECHHPNWRTPSFFRGVGIPPTRYG